MHAQIPTKFDAIVVGAGPAGATAAYHLARAGLKTLLVERGRGAGSKQVFGGRIYLAPLKEALPDVEKAPIHRWVTRERVSIVKGEKMLSIDFVSSEKNSFTTYLTQFTNWIVDHAVKAGAVYVDEVRVDKLVVDNGWVRGIEAVGGDRVYADVVIDAEGVNRLLLERAGLVERPSPEMLALGVKEVIKIGKEEIERRFGLEDGEGLAWVLVGDVTNMLPGGAFIYTNKDSVSIGLVVHLGRAAEMASEEVYRLVEKLRLHPLLHKYLDGGDIIEYSAHLTIESGYRFMPRKLALNGLMITGDAAGLLLNTGFTFRGVDYAVYSGYLAAKAAIEAHRAGDYSEATLRREYEDKLRKSFIYRDLSKHRGVEEIMADPKLFRGLVEASIATASKVFELEKETPTLFEAINTSFREAGLGLLSTLIKLLFLVRKL